MKNSIRKNFLQQMKNKKVIIIVGIIASAFLIYVVSALLAYQRSKEIFKNFKTVDESLAEINAKYNLKSNNYDHVVFPPEIKVKVDELKNRTNDIINKIEKLKNETVTLCEENRSYEDFLIKQGNANQLKIQLELYRNFITDKFSDVLNVDIKNTVKINVNDVEEDGILVPWEEYYFKHMPLAAIVCNLGKFSSEIKQTENKIIKFYADSLNVKSKQK